MDLRIMDLLLPLSITICLITMIIYRKFQLFDDTAKQERDGGVLRDREVLGRMKVSRVSNAGRARASPQVRRQYLLSTDEDISIYVVDSLNLSHLRFAKKYEIANDTTPLVRAIWLHIFIIYKKRIETNLSVSLNGLDK